MAVLADRSTIIVLNTDMLSYLLASPNISYADKATGVHNVLYSLMSNFLKKNNESFINQ